MKKRIHISVETEDGREEFAAKIEGLFDKLSTSEYGLDLVVEVLKEAAANVTP